MSCFSIYLELIVHSTSTNFTERIYNFDSVFPIFPAYTLIRVIFRLIWFKSMQRVMWLSYHTRQGMDEYLRGEFIRALADVH